MKEEKKIQKVKNIEKVKESKKAEKIKNPKKEKRKIILPKIERKKLNRIITISSIIIAAIVLISLVVVLYNSFKYDVYKKYEDKMNLYGFSQIYDNGSAKTNESITKIEAIKMVLSTIYNYSNFDSFYFYPEDANDEELAKLMADKGILDNADDYDKKVKYIDVLKYFSNAKKIYLNEELNNSDEEIKNISKYSLDDQAIIKDMVANKIIELQNKKLPLGSYAVKGMLNEIVVNFAVKYNTITIKGEKININPEKTPSNYQDYPYTLSTVDKAIYEIENVKQDDEYETSAQVYKEIKEEYNYIDELIKKFTNTLLNVDYTKLDKDKFKEDMRSVSLFNIPDLEFNEYFDYVQSNKIQTSGSAEVQYPAIYFDGIVYRVRTIITLNVNNADESTNLLFRDLGRLGDVKYDGKIITKTIDIPISRYYNSQEFAVYVNSLFPAEDIVQENTGGEGESTGIW